MGYATAKWDNLGQPVLLSCIHQAILLDALEVSRLSHSPDCPTLCLLYKLWMYLGSLLKYEGYNAFSPICDNYNPPGIRKLENCDLWKVQGITYVPHYIQIPS